MGIVIDVAPLTELAVALLRLLKSIDLDMVGMRGWPFRGDPFVHEEMAPLPAAVRVLDASRLSTAESTLERHVSLWRVSTSVPLVPRSTVELEQLSAFLAVPLPLVVPHFPPRLREAYHFLRATVYSLCRELMQNPSVCPMGGGPPLAPDGVRQDLFPAAVYILAWRSSYQAVVQMLVASPLSVALMNFVSIGSSSWLPFVRAGQVVPSPSWSPLRRHIQGWDEAITGRDAHRRVAVCGVFGRRYRRPAQFLYLYRALRTPWTWRTVCVGGGAPLLSSSRPFRHGRKRVLSVWGGQW